MSVRLAGDARNSAGHERYMRRAGVRACGRVKGRPPASQTGLTGASTTGHADTWPAAADGGWRVTVEKIRHRDGFYDD